MSNKIGFIPFSFCPLMKTMKYFSVFHFFLPFYVFDCFIDGLDQLPYLLSLLLQGLLVRIKSG